MHYRQTATLLLLYTLLTSIDAFKTISFSPLQYKITPFRSHNTESIVPPSSVEVEWEFVKEPMKKLCHENLPGSGNSCQQQSPDQIVDEPIYNAVFCGYKCTDEEKTRLRSANIDENPIDDYCI